MLLASISINDVVVTEGNSGTTDAVFAVTLNQPPDQPVTVNYTTADSSATTPADYQPGSGTLMFNPGGPTTQNIVVKVVGDTRQEGNEQFSVNLNTPVNATIINGSGSGTGYIVDDDEALLTMQNVSVAEGDSGATDAVFTVTRGGSTAGTTTVNYATAPSSATTPADFATASGTLVFAPGETRKTITVAVAGDTLQENPEQFSVTLSGVDNGTVLTASAVGTIIDDDASTFTVHGGVSVEGDRDPTGIVFTVGRQGSLDGPASVQYETSNSSATSGNDFVATSGSLNFAPGEATKQVSVPLLPDTVEEPTELFNLSLKNADNATIADGSAQGTIIDDDAVSWTIETAAVVEGSSGTTPLEFKVRRFGQVGGPATISYATSNSSAVAPADYVAANGTLSFAPLEEVKTVTVQVNGDTAQEPSEAFNVSLSNPSTGTVVQGTAAGYIVDDDESFVAITSDDVAVAEGNSGTTPVTFKIARYGSLAGTTTVTYGTVNGTAVTPSDYAVASGTVTFNPGETSKTVSVDVAGDTTPEPNEYFFVNIVSATNATVAENSAPVSVVNDDGAVPTAYFFLGDAAVVEGDSGTTPATFTVRRLGNTDAAVSVNYTIGAPAGGDYQVASGTLSFAAGDTSKTFSINVVGDTLDENSEQFTVSLTAPTAGSVIADNAGTLTVIDDENVVVWVSDASTAEGDDPAGRDVHLTFRRLGKTAGVSSSVNYATAPSTATTPQDYQTASGTVAFAPGEDNKDVVVRVVGDTVQENAEQFFANLSAANNATILGGNGRVLVFDDDQSSVAVDDVTLVEGSGANGPSAVFTVTRYGSTDGQSAVHYTTNISSATAGDFTASNGTLTFGPGETSKTLAVPVNADTLQEATEQFFLDLSAPDNTAVARNRGTAVIVDDDASSVTLGGGAVTEGDTGTNAAVFTLTRFGSLAGESSVEFRTTNSSATAPSDFTQVIQTVTFGPGESSKTIPVLVNGDTVQEANEIFSGNLQAAVNTTVVASGSNYGTILDDDQSFLYVDNVVVVEGDPATPNTAVFTVRRLGSLDGQTAVTYGTLNNSATAPGDFTLTSGTLTFAPGVSSQTISVPITADRTRENAEEYFFVQLSSPDNATIGDGSGRGTILDDDPAPTVTQVYVGSTAWGGDDGNAGTITFKEYLQAQGLGSTAYGFAVAGGAGQLQTLPWSDVNRVSIKFSQDVSVDRQDLSVRGTNTPTYSFLAGPDGFSYDAATHVATWTVDKNLTKDRILLDLDSSSPNGIKNDGNEFLDGEWTNGGDSYPSGNGLGGGDFLFRMNVLPGDVNRTNSVLADDYSEVKRRFFRSATAPGPAGATQYDAFHDLDGSGSTLANDYSAVKGRFFDSLPAAQPTAATLFGVRRIAPPRAAAGVLG